MGFESFGKSYYCPDHENQRPASTADSDSSNESGDDDGDSEDSDVAIDAKWMDTGFNDELEAMSLAEAALKEEHHQGTVSDDDGAEESKELVAEDDESQEPLPQETPAPMSDGDARFQHDVVQEFFGDDDDGGVVVERLPYGVDADELDIESDDESDFGADDRLQHLRDIVGQGSVHGSDASDSDDGNDNEEWSRAPLGDVEDGQWMPHSWSFEQSRRQRLAKVAVFLHKICDIVAHLSTMAEKHVETARREKSEAAASAFKQSRVVGATVVGATRRLQALR